MGSHTNNKTTTEGSFSDAFSALQLLRSYNSLIAPTSNASLYESYSAPDCVTREPTEPGMLSPLTPSAASFSLGGLLQPPLLTDAVPPIVPPVGLATTHPFANASAAAAVSRNIIENAVISSMHHARRPRSEKKPIPDEQKDDRYYERRKRNNQAAKKSRDARKIREDQIALRATVLEYENARLRGQVVELYEECRSLRQLLIKQRMPSVSVQQSTSNDQLTDRSISSTVTLTPANSVNSLPCQV